MTAASPAPGKIVRLAALCGAAALPVAALVLTAVNLLQAADVDSLASSQETMVAQLERRAAAAKPLEAVVDSGAIYVPGATPTLAKAALQRLAVDAVERASGRVIETEEVADDTQDDAAPVDRARLRISFDATNGALLDLLHGVETGLPLLIVEKIEIRRLEGDDPGGADPVLRISLVISGATRIGSG